MSPNLLRYVWLYAGQMARVMGWARGLQAYRARRRVTHLRESNREAYRLVRALGTDPVDPRELSPEELGVLRRLVSRDWEGAEAARLQLAHARHAGPSHPGHELCFEIAVAGEVPLVERPNAKYGPVTGLVVYSGEKGVWGRHPIGMIDLWVADGLLSCVEYSSFIDELPTEWPSAAQLTD